MGKQLVKSKKLVSVGGSKSQKTVIADNDIFDDNTRSKIKRTKKEVESMIQRQQNRKPFTRNTGGSDIIRIWSDKKHDYEYYQYYQYYNDKTDAQSMAKYLRTQGIKSRVKRNPSLYTGQEWIVYQEIEIIKEE
jgi:hypothetical protein